MPIDQITSASIENASIAQVDLSTGVAGTGPAFSAYANNAQTISGNILTKIQYNTERFDTNSNYDSTTNYRFTPTVAGYYQINASATFSGTAGGYTLLSFYKNGSAYWGTNTQRANANYNAMFLSDVIYFNGSTDYLEVYGCDNATSDTIVGSNINTFSGALVRAA
jgi:hypothetical protein